MDVFFFSSKFSVKTLSRGRKLFRKLRVSCRADGTYVRGIGRERIMFSKNDFSHTRKRVADVRPEGVLRGLRDSLKPRFGKGDIFRFGSYGPETGTFLIFWFWFRFRFSGFFIIKV